MRKLALLLLLLTPLPSCRPNYEVAEPTSPCVVPPWPAYPAVMPYACPENPELVCMTPGDVVKLARYIHDSSEVELALEACSLVVRK